MRIAEPTLGAIALSLVAAGIAAYFGVHNFRSLIGYSLVWSVGLHLWMTIQPSMVLSLADERSKGRRLGQISAVGAVGTILGMGLVFIAGDRIGMRSLFVIAGAIIFLGAITVSMLSKDFGHKEKPRIVWNRRYSLYYTLTFLEGCRKQVFMTFAVFALVRNYGTPLRIVAVLMIVNNLVNATLAPRVGRLIDRIGERKVLAFCYAALIPVFIGYAVVRIPSVLYVLYCLDNLFFLGSIGLNTYLHKIAKPADVMPSLAMGVSMNHAAAVVVPVVGGYIWTKFDYPTTFIGGAVVVAISVLAALRIRTN
jgi:predicted MFS family arabinose efflux permease